MAFDQVHLTYAGAGGESLSGVSFTALPGQTVGVIGGTGSGKTSLVHLIPRFYDVTGGTVTVLGRPVEDWAQAELRQAVGIVLQKAQLFAGTIRSNLLWATRLPVMPPSGRRWRRPRPPSSSAPSPWAWTSPWNKGDATSPAASGSG